jgi:hypothetical protein
MSNLPTNTSPRRWHLLILDTTPADMKWLIAEITSPDHVCPAELGAGPGSPGWTEITAWLRGVLGLDQASLVPLRRPEVWQIDG